MIIKEKKNLISKYFAKLVSFVQETKFIGMYICFLKQTIKQLFLVK